MNTGRLRPLHFAAALLAAAWVALSLTRAGLRVSLGAAVGPVRPAAVTDARRGWSGPYCDALDRLTVSLGRGSTVAVVLGEADRPGQPTPTARMDEAVYRLYPLRPDFYFGPQHGNGQPYWFECRAGEAPQVPGLWQHDAVFWAQGGTPLIPRGYHLDFSNSAAAVYRKQCHPERSEGDLIPSAPNKPSPRAKRRS